MKNVELEDVLVNEAAFLLHFLQHLLCLLEPLVVHLGDGINIHSNLSYEVGFEDQGN